MNAKDIGKWILVFAAASLLAQVAIAFWPITLVALAAWGGWWGADRLYAQWRGHTVQTHPQQPMPPVGGRIVLFDRSRRHRNEGIS